MLVASKPELLKPGRADVWDSKLVRSPDSALTYAGPPLKSRTRYYWSIQVQTTDGITSEWLVLHFSKLCFSTPMNGEVNGSPDRNARECRQQLKAKRMTLRFAAAEIFRPPAWLTTGFAADRFKNDQGECREIRPTPLLRKSFTITKPIAKARVYSSGLAYNDLTINGHSTSESVLDPGFTDYSKTVLYTTHDVTKLLRQGENVVASELGSGRYDDSTRTWDWGWDKAQWRASPKLRLDLYITYADGTEQIVASDNTWKISTDGPTRYDSLFLGERTTPGVRSRAGSSPDSTTPNGLQLVS